jgi:hypothetical protein
MATYTTAGSKFYIGTTAAADDLTEFQADTYIAVGELMNIGTFGDKSEVIEFSTISDSRIRKIKGLRDAGTLSIEVAYDSADAGQTAMRAAAASDLDYNFKIVLTDKPSPTGTPSEFFLRGSVLSQEIEVGDGKTVLKQKFDVSVNQAPVQKPAAA